MTIYYFRIYNNIGNNYNFGRMVGSKEDVEKYCKQQIQEARKNSNAIYKYEMQLIPPKKRLRQ